MRSHRFGCPPASRLRQPGEFRRAYAGGKKFATAMFSATVMPNESGRPRLGMSVAVRTMGSAVERNRVRRLIRETFRLTQYELPAVDIVVGVRTAARGAGSQRLRSGLEQLWNTIATCAFSSASSSAPTSSP